MASICLCMIAKDEAQNIARCIQSVDGLADEIVLVDTGSTDATPQIAQDLGAKVFHYDWDDSFANARNFAISKAESDWLLLLDPDEALDQGSIEELRKFTETTDLDGANFRMRNYTGTYAPDRYSLHCAMRLLRNCGKYYFHGAIHEQIIDGSGENLTSRFASLGVIVHHYGYLDQVVKEKQKRRRNLPILEKQLADDPTEPFTLFNIGNEYLSMQKYQQALEYYQSAVSNLRNRNLAFVPHLFFRIISCFETLKNPEKALETAEEGLAQFPRCTDFEFRRGDILYKLGRYTLAIESYEKCLAMGVPPFQLEFLPGCGTYLPAYNLGELYFQLEDYKRAVKYFGLTLSLKQDFYAALYRLGTVFNHIYSDKNTVYKMLFAYFAQPKYTPNALVGADILIQEGLLEQALDSLSDLTVSEEYGMELTCTRARILFYNQQFEEAAPLLESVCRAQKPEVHILPAIQSRSALLLFTIGLIVKDDERLSQALSHIQELCTPSEHTVAVLMKELACGRTPEDPHYADEGRRELADMLRILELLLKTHQFDLFEQMLSCLNYVDSNEILLRLAQLYEKNNLPTLAADHVLRSIKELDTLDASGAEILLRQLR